MKINQYTMATIATLLVGSPLVAQQPLPAQSQAVERQAAQSNPIQVRAEQARPDQIKASEVASDQKSLARNSQSKNQTFAKCLAITNQEQVLIARFAAGKATTDDVKAFAVTLEGAHQSSLDELNGLVSKGETNRVSADGRSENAASNSSNVDFLQLHQEMSEQCLKDSEELLSKKEGIAFDKCFVGMQVAKHAAMHTNLTVLQRHASGDLQGWIKEGLAKNAQHMEAAVSLMEQLAVNDSSGTPVTAK
jgi:predicted outer membrane protein